MNVYKFEVWMLRKSIFIWAFALPALLLFYIAFFPLIAADGAGYDAMFEAFPEEFMAFFGINPDLPMSSIMGYLSLTYGMIQVPIAIQAANYGFHMLSVEERELTADFLLTKPVSRKTILLAKLGAAFTSLMIVNITVWLGVILAVVLFSGDSPFEWSNILIMLSSNVFLQLFFVGVGMFLSTVLQKISSVLSFSMGLGIGLYVISSLGDMLMSSFFKVLSPFSHFAPSYILVEGTYEWSVAWISFVIIIGSLAGSYFFYQRRNIASL